MTDKEKIRKFLEGMANADCCVTQVAKVINKIILPYIDSLQEESVSEDLEEEWKRYITSEEYLNDIPGGLPVARHFANWQKRQDDKILNEKQWEAWAKGGEEMKQELMKDAIEGYVDMLEFPDKTWIELSAIPKDLKDGDKVKLIIIKED